MKLMPVLAFAGVILAAGAPRAEDAVVLATTAPSLTLGQIVPDGGRVALPDGTSAVFLLASGRTLPVRGPFDGRLEAAPQTAQSSTGWGAGRFAQNDVAASRSLTTGPADALRRAPAMDLSAGGRHCAVAGQPPLIARPADPTFARMILSDRAGAVRVNLAWGGDGVASWPKEIALGDATRVVVSGVDGMPRVEAEIRALPAETIKAKGLPLALADAGCARQARALLSALRDALAPIDLSLSSDRGPDPTYRRGEPVRLTVRTSRDAKVYCLLRDARGDLVPIFPSPMSGGPLVHADIPLELPGTRMPAALNADNQDVRCIALEASAPEVLPPVAAFRPLGRETEARLDAVLGAAPRGAAATSQVVLRAQ